MPGSRPAGSAPIRSRRTPSTSSTEGIALRRRWWTPHSREGAMSRHALRSIGAFLLAAAGFAPGCGGGPREALLRSETFTWVRQPIAFSPPPARWERQGDSGGGSIGVRFILRGGGGQCISITAFRILAERDRRKDLARLISRRDSLSRREFLDALSLARARIEDPISDREAAAARAI